MNINTYIYLVSVVTDVAKSCKVSLIFTGQGFPGVSLVVVFFSVV